MEENSYIEPREACENVMRTLFAMGWDMAEAVKLSEWPRALLEKLYAERGRGYHTDYAPPVMSESTKDFAKGFETGKCWCEVCHRAYLQGRARLEWERRNNPQDDEDVKMSDDFVSNPKQHAPEDDTEFKVAVKAALAKKDDSEGTMAKKNEENGIDIRKLSLERSGDKVILPKGMTIKQGIEWLMAKQKEDDEDIAINESIDAYPFDAAFALQTVLADKYGWANYVPTPGFFGSSPPMMIGVDIGLKENGDPRTVQVAWGRMQLPNVKGYLQTSVGYKEGRFIFTLSGVVKRVHKDEVSEIADLVRAYVREHSIYKGKAIRIKFAESGEDFNPNDAPKFLDTTRVREEELIFPIATDRLVKNALFTPIERSAQCRAAQVPLKRGVLLEGPYGTGKTLTAYVTAKKAEVNGWTFLYLASVTQLAAAIHFAKQYQPCVIFAEDVDTVLDGERDDSMNDILNVVDGVDTKGTEILIVLTTNHVEKINPAMLRPGRLDAVVSVRPPDAQAVEKLIRLYGRGRLAKKVDLAAVGEKLKGQIPATIREVLERAKLAAITNAAENAIDGELQLTTNDLELAADSMLEHLKIMQPRPGDMRTAVEVLGDRLGERIGAVVTGMEPNRPKTTNGRSTTTTS